jgi:periodic tryptophan protein 2
MKLNFKFTNLCGVVYKGGAVTFTPDGNTLLSPVGNRVTAFDLVNHTSVTLPFESGRNIDLLAISPDGNLLLVIDEAGKALLVNYPRRIVLAPFNFHEKVRSVVFSPTGKYFTVSHGKHARIYKTPGLNKTFAPFVLVREHYGHKEDVTCVDWSSDGSLLLTGSKDSTARLRPAAIGSAKQFKQNSESERYMVTLAGHRDQVLGAFFNKNDRIIFTVAKDGALFVWRYTPNETKSSGWSSSSEDEPASDVEEQDKDEASMTSSSGDSSGSDSSSESESSDSESKKAKQTKERRVKTQMAKGRWSLYGKFFFWSTERARVYSVKFHKISSLMVVGFANGVFGLYDLSNLERAAQLGKDAILDAVTNEASEAPVKLICLQKLSISSRAIDAVAVNHTGEWLAFGISGYGQLLVWEWQSEKYVLKQQGHLHQMTSMSYSPEGQYIATGGHDGKIKVWNTSSGFCFVTLKDHSGPVTDVQFSPKGQVIVSSSNDGTVRAFDMIRYRNFRTLTSPKPTQFSCVAIDPSGELVAAGSLTDFSVYVWSLQTGKLLDVLDGHEGPVTTIKFSPQNPQLATGSWDSTIKIWELYSGSNAAVESFKHSADLTAIAYRPDGKQICAATLDGNLVFWNPLEGTQEYVIEGRRDINAGRGSSDFRTAKNNASSKYFTCVTYSADGRCVLAGGNSRFVCLYEISNRILLKKFQISHNMSLEGILDFLDSRKDGEPEDFDSEDDEDIRDRPHQQALLPGVQQGDFAKRQNASRIATTEIGFAPSGRQWACTTTAGLVIYSLDDQMLFDPYMLDIDITPETILETLKDEVWLKALVMALRLNEFKITKKVFCAIPPANIKLTAQQLHPVYIQRFVNFLATHMETSNALEFHLTWVHALFAFHGQYFKQNATTLATSMRHLQRATLKLHQEMQSICDENRYLIQFTKISQQTREIEEPLPEQPDEVLAESAVEQKRRKKEKEREEEEMMNLGRIDLPPASTDGKKRKHTS